MFYNSMIYKFIPSFTILISRWCDFIEFNRVKNFLDNYYKSIYEGGK